MLGTLDYINIAYLVILFLITAYLRRNNTSKFKSQLAFAFLLVACLSTLVFFALFYLTISHERFYVLYFVSSVSVLISSIVIVYFNNRNIKSIELEITEKEENEE